MGSAHFPRPLAVAKAFAMLEEVEGKGQGQWFDWKSAMLASFVQWSAIFQNQGRSRRAFLIGKIGRGYEVMMVYASVMTMFDNHDLC